MTKRHLAAPFSIGMLLAATLGLSACATGTIDEAVPIASATPVAAKPADATTTGVVVPEDSRVFTNAEVDARTRELRARSGGRGAGGGASGNAADNRDAALSRQDDMLKRIERSGS